MDFREELQKEANETALSNKNCTIVLPVRTGKTLVGLRIAEQYKKVLVSYPNKAIKASWLEDSEKFGIDISHIDFTTHVSLPKRDLEAYDVVILDEIDQVSLNSWAYISENRPKELKGLTGTPPVKGDKRYCINRFAPIKYRKTLDDTTGKTNKDYKICVHLIKPDEEKNIPLSKGGFWSEKQKIAYFDRRYENSRNFNDMLMLMRSIQNSHSKLAHLSYLVEGIDRGLFFVETQEQCKLVGLPAYHTQEKNSELHLEQFQTGEIDKLVTINQLKAGVTFPDLNEIVILHCYSSNNRAHQKIGRALNYAEGETAIIHIICLKGTRDEDWLKSGLAEFDKTKIQWLT